MKLPILEHITKRARFCSSSEIIGGKLVQADCRLYCRKELVSDSSTNICIHLDNNLLTTSGKCINVTENIYSDAHVVCTQVCGTPQAAHTNFFNEGNLLKMPNFDIHSLLMNSQELISLESLHTK